MIKAEMHLHTKPASGCAKEEPKTVLEIYKKAGYKAIVLTNHYCKDCFDYYPGSNKKEKLDFYFSLFDEMKELGKSYGIKVFLGAEVRTDEGDESIFSEYLLHGFDRDFFYQNKELFLLNQKDLFKLCDANGVFMAESHPFRTWVVTGNPKFMHGAESFNGHIGHNNQNDLAEAFVKKNNLIGISGTDFHNVSQVPNGGILIPESIETEKQFAKYLFDNKFEILKEEK